MKIFLNLCSCVCVSILLCELKVLHQTSRWHKFQANPSNAKALMKRKSPPPPTSTHPFFGSLPLSPLWHTLGDCTSLSASHTTFSTHHCQPSNSICFPLSLAALICMREMSHALPSIKKDILLHLACDRTHRVPIEDDTCHSLCTCGVEIDVNSRLI